MKPDKQFQFGPFRLDESNECLWRDSDAITLRPKAYAVLKYLVERPGELVTKQELLEGVWPDTFVSDAVLKDSIRQLRDALGDEAKAPQFIETAHRRGYRFIAEVNSISQRLKRDATSPPLVPGLQQGTTTVLGREVALSQMRKWLDHALSGTRQIVFVTGETGIGKTAIVEAFLGQLDPDDIRVARGQCLQQYGAGEAYLPVLDAFTRLRRDEKSNPMAAVLRSHAPTWLAQMPWLTTAEDPEERKHQLGTTREHMLREMAEAIEASTSDTPMIMVLEDLHWSDYSTLDLVSYLAQRRQPARFMLIGTYRPVEVILSEHPLKGVKQELQMHKLCHELPVEYLPEQAVAEFLHMRFPQNEFPKELATMIHARTEGNPLFMVNVVDYLIDEEIVSEQSGKWNLQVKLDEVELGVPENIRLMIEKHIERLSSQEQKMLEGASVVGMECSALAISAGLDEDVVRVEEVCDGMARDNHFLFPAYLAELPDGTITPRYRFIHALYLDVLYRRVAATRRARIHGRIGERGEAVYGNRSSEIAAELAVHFEQARDWARAVKYLLIAAENAARRSANREAVELAMRGLELLKSLPASAERAAQESSLQERLFISQLVY
jgi:predicted ATPase/DNA-binding winged helix-turn-helix (wHTH) protein